MVRVEASVDISRSTEEVFAYVADPTKAPEWMSGILENTVEGGGPIHIGSRIHGVTKILRRFEYTGEVTQYDPPHALVIRGALGSGTRAKTRSTWNRSDAGPGCAAGWNWRRAACSRWPTRSSKRS